MVSNRLPSDLEPNRLTEAVRAMRAEGRAFVDLTESNPTRAGFDYPADLLSCLSNPRALTYDPNPLGAIEARRAVARDYARQGIAVDAERVVLTASTSEAYSLLFKLLTDAGDGVLVPRPSYPLFEHLTQLDLVTPIAYDLEYVERASTWLGSASGPPNGRWSIDVDGLARAIGPRTRAVLLVSPNNPTGSFVSRDELDRVAAICADRRVAIIADEVFADYEIEPGAIARAGRAAAQDRALTFALGGLSKTAGLPQVKLGWIAVTGPDALVRDALRNLELVCDTYLSVSTPAQLAAAELLDRGAVIRRQIVERVRANHRHLALRAADVPSCRVLHVEGGWYAVVQVPSLQPEEDLVLALLRDRGVLAHPGYFFDFASESFLILSLLPPEPAFRDGVDRVLRHFDCTRSRSVEQ